MRSLVNRSWRWIRSRTPARVSANALALLASQGGARLLNLALIASLTRALGVASLGRYLLAVTVQGVTLAVSDLGLNTLATREFSRERPTREGEALLGTVLALKLVGSLLGALLLNGLVAPLFFGGDRRVLIAFASVALLPEAFSGLAGSLVKAHRRMEVSSAITLGSRALTALSGILLVRKGYDERALLIAGGAASVLGAIAFLCVLRAWDIRPRWGEIRGTWRGILSEAIPFAITGGTAMLYTRLDLLMLSTWRGDLAAGVYGAAYRLWEALGMIPSSLLDALFPELSRLGGEDRARGSLHALYLRGRTVMVVLIVVLTVPCLLAAPLLLPLLYGRTSDSSISTSLFRLLLLAFPFTHLYLLNGHALYAIGHQMRVTWAMVALTAINGLLNALVIPTWSYWGAAGVALLSEILLFALLQRDVRRLILHTATSQRDAGRDLR
jgi:O-antigen/teichoic acid export membrane protein